MSGDRPLFMRRRREIERVKREGRRYPTSLFVLLSCPSTETHPRVCVIVGSRFGTAVARNRAKRRFRALARRFRQQLVNHRAFVVFPRREALKAPYAELAEVWVSALRHEGLLTGC